MRTVINALTDVAEGLRAEYELKDDKYHLKLEGDTPLGFVTATEHATVNGKLAEFRENNRGLNSSKTELENKLKLYDGIDPAEHKTLKDKVAAFESKGAKDPADIDTRIRAAVDPLVSEIKELKTSKAVAEERLSRKELETALTTAGQKAGVEVKAFPDYLSRGLSVFSMKDGKPVAKKGDTPMFSKEHPDEPLGVEEWAAGLATEAPHLFKTSKGGGAQPAAGGNGNIGGKKVISGADPLEFGENLEAIAKGDVIIAPSA